MNARERAALDRWIMEPPELEEEEPPEYCDSPGPKGCGGCPGCTDWGDMEYDRKRDKELEEAE
jgi:hypothetical protein